MPGEWRIGFYDDRRGAEELEYRGVFRILDEPGEETLKIFAARVAPAAIYPFLRQALADVILRAGKPPLHLPIVDFATAFDPATVELRGIEQVEEDTPNQET